jgi:hypothetical protein
MQKSTVNGSHGMGVDVLGNCDEAGGLVALDGGKVSVSTAVVVAVGIEVGTGAQAVSKKREIRKVMTRFMFFPLQR